MEYGHEQYTMVKEIILIDIIIGYTKFDFALDGSENRSKQYTMIHLISWYLI